MSSSAASPTAPESWNIVEFLEAKMRGEAGDPFSLDALPTAAHAIAALTAHIRRADCGTMMGLEVELKEAVAALQRSQHGSVALTAACDLFALYVTRTALELPTFDACKAKLIERGDFFLKNVCEGRRTIAASAASFIRDGQVILVHGFSRVVLAVLLRAGAAGKRFSVIAPECRPDASGYHTAKVLCDAGIAVELVLDAAIGAVMERVDFVFVGAEGVVENGGIINSIGTQLIAMAARVHARPFYVAAESYKFTRLYPLCQADLPPPKPGRNTFEPCIVVARDGGAPPAPVDLSHPLLTLESPSVDFTPPEYITLLFTDLGILTPSAISDELIKLYC